MTTRASGGAESDYARLADCILATRRMPTIIVTPVFEFKPGEAPVFVGLWRDEKGQDYTWDELPSNSIFAAAGKGDNIT